MSSPFEVNARVRWSPAGQHMKNVPVRVPTEAEAKEGVTVDDMPAYGEGPFTVKAVTTFPDKSPAVVLKEIGRPGFAAHLLERAPAKAEVDSSELIAAE